MRSEIHLSMQYTDDLDPAIGYLAVENEMRSGSISPVPWPDMVKRLAKPRR
jgi:hypothetical protein